MSASNRLILGPDQEGRTLVVSGDRVERFGHATVADELETPRNEAQIRGADTLDAPPSDFPILAADAGSRTATSAGAENHILCPDGVIAPGCVNAHTHIYSGLAPLGMPEPQPPPQNFLQILERVWWRLDRALDEASLRASARLYAAESLLAGTTMLIDHHESPNFIEGSLDVLADACEEIGIRAVLCYGATERNGGFAEGKRGLQECRRFIDSNERSLVQGICALHASFTVSDALIKETATLSRELGTVTHIHVAEDGADNEDARRRGYEGPLERLLAHAALRPGSILAHCVHCDRSQVRLAAQQELWIVQNPRSNRGNRVGYPMSLGESKRVALGTDGYPANMSDEREALAEEATAHGEPLAIAHPRLEAGHKLAAQRFGRTFAPLVAGTVADIVVRDSGASEDADPFDDQEPACAPGPVRHVVVDGKLVVRDGKLLTANLDEIRAEAREQAPRLWERMRAL
ncbi:MAG: amidohydrolase family protein [Acidobacteriota bacterium]